MLFLMPILYTLLQSTDTRNTTQLSSKQGNLDATPAIDRKGKLQLNSSECICQNLKPNIIRRNVKRKATGLSRQDFHGLIRTRSQAVWVLPGSVVRRDSAIALRNEHLATGSGKECLSAVLKESPGMRCSGRGYGRDAQREYGNIDPVTGSIEG